MEQSADASSPSLMPASDGCDSTLGCDSDSACSRTIARSFWSGDASLKQLGDRARFARIELGLLLLLLPP
jgi:hypothetical protein